jgi:GntR family transcriptional regulator
MNSTIADDGIHFCIDSASGIPFYRQVIQWIEHAILAGKLRPGDRLPTIRALAVELKINPNTIAKAYGELEIRGIVMTQVGSGTFVSDRPVDGSGEELRKKIEELLGRFMKDMAALGIDREQVYDFIRDCKEER